MIRSRKKSQIWLILSLILIAIFFAITIYCTFLNFKKTIITKQVLDQEKIARITSNILTKYFDTLIYITENTALQKSFINANTQNDIAYLHKSITRDNVKRIAQEQNISTYLETPTSTKTFKTNSTNYHALQIWQLFKGFPQNSSLIKERLTTVENISKTYPDILYFFLTSANGDIIFIYPYKTQKQNKSFNYKYRESIIQTKATKMTVISEAYLSNTTSPIQTISVTSPVLDNNKQIISIFGITISATMLKKSIFNILAKDINITDSTVLYLIDQHGHVITSSSGENNYLPKKDINTDNLDVGNFRNIPILQNLYWNISNYEKNSIWQRKTASWDEAKMLPIYHMQYINKQGLSVIGTFLPVSLHETNKNFGILIETPTNQLFSTEKHLKNMFFIIFIILLIILSNILIFTFKRFNYLEKSILEEQKNKQESISKLTSQVAHDIRSPVASLRMISHYLKDVSQDFRELIHNITQQITDIADNLLLQIPGNIDPRIESVNPENISGLIEDAIKTLKLRYLDSSLLLHLEIAPQTYKLFAKVNATSFKSVISNLINNAAEAQQLRGEIKVKLITRYNYINVSIEDTGCGMSLNTINKVLKGSVSIGKKNGHGLGLASSKQKIESWKGNFIINSKVGYGTTIIISLPIIL